ncbi:UNVERIFIED_CONTAM: hypothetical protein NCL1_14173 [Trichonephila clavipes]
MKGRTSYSWLPVSALVIPYFSLYKDSQLFLTDDTLPKNVIIIWRLTTELNTERSLYSYSRFCLCKLDNTKRFLFTSRHFSASALIAKKGGKLANVSRTSAHMPANKTVLSFDV